MVPDRYYQVKRFSTPSSVTAEDTCDDDEQLYTEWAWYWQDDDYEETDDGEWQMFDPLVSMR